MQCSKCGNLHVKKKVFVFGNRLHTKVSKENLIVSPEMYNLVDDEEEKLELGCDCKTPSIVLFCDYCGNVVEEDDLYAFETQRGTLLGCKKHKEELPDSITAKKVTLKDFNIVIQD